MFQLQVLCLLLNISIMCQVQVLCLLLHTCLIQYQIGFFFLFRRVRVPRNRTEGCHTILAYHLMAELPHHRSALAVSCHDDVERQVRGICLACNVTRYIMCY